jgi:glutamyl-Q tRNA(Asp) synthetase
VRLVRVVFARARLTAMIDDVPATAPVLRFAPSPNGALHLGHAYSALMNERLAAELGGRLILRIEDLDRTRCKAQFEAAIIEDLAWLGLRFPARPRRQSEHGDDYAAALARLDERGLVYPCFCSRSEIIRASNGRRDPEGAPLYPGTCRALSSAQARDRLARGDKAAFRLNMPRALDAAPAGLWWIEYGEGAIPSRRPATPESWGDVVLKGRDLAASYHLAVVVDDALQGVTDVARGRDLLAATAVHRLLQALLRLPAPRYRHHRLVLDESGAKLSKSRQSVSLDELRGTGLGPGEVRAALGFGSGAGGALSVEFG